VPPLATPADQLPLSLSPMYLGYSEDDQLYRAFLYNTEVDPLPGDGLTARKVRLRFWHRLEPGGYQFWLRPHDGVNDFIFNPGSADTEANIGRFGGAVDLSLDYAATDDGQEFILEFYRWPT
jgi:hypothetical protein